MVNLNKKKGISLIVLVITIIVMIILAAAIILSLNSSGIIGKANQAKTDSDKAAIEEYVSTLRAEWELQDIATRGASFSEYANAKLVEKGYTGYTVTEDGKVQKFINGGAVDVANNASTYYGKTISNYTAGGVNEWQVFHSDGENIYLIAKGYADVSSNTELDNYDYILFNSLVNGGTYNTINMPLYDQTAIKWLNLGKNISNSYNVAITKYMLDTSKWSSFADTTYAKYAIGGPTIEMFCDSYNKVTTGQEIHYNEVGKGGYLYPEYNIYIEKNPNELYYIVDEEDSKDYSELWLASPSDDDTNYSNVMTIVSCEGKGNIGRKAYDGGKDGGDGGAYMRPVVCLNSNVKLVQAGTNYKLEK